MIFKLGLEEKAGKRKRESHRDNVYLREHVNLKENQMEQKNGKRKKE